MFIENIARWGKLGYFRYDGNLFILTKCRFGKDMEADFNIASYCYDLPEERIAQFPAPERDQSRLLVLDIRNNTLQDANFIDILNFFQPGDLLVVNDTRVFPARLEGRKPTGGKVELFLLEYPDFQRAELLEEIIDQDLTRRVQCLNVTGLLKSSKRPKTGSRLFFSPVLEGELLHFSPDGKTLVRLYFDVTDGTVPEEIIQKNGRIPLPPYIQRGELDYPADRERYQTLFAQKSGAVAAPTAGLHFSAALLKKLHKMNIDVAPITLHVGYGTFAPVRVTDIRKHEIHEEYVEVSSQTAEMINRTIASGKKVWTVGTTTVRALEFAASENGRLGARHGWCGLYIYPGYTFKVVTNLITNFHLPGSSLLFLVAALAGRSHILQAYEEAILRGYRFYSYGDAMLIIT
jgi:S-adenosylmethionine:tRNA ribosyltransferase-isomerase